MVLSGSKKILFFLIALISIAIPMESYGQSKKDFYQKMDSLANEMFVIQLKKDSLNAEMEKRHRKLEEQQKKKIKHERRKNLILSVALVVAIIVISIIQ